MVKLDKYAYLEASAMLQLSFCVRWSLRPEWDYDKVAIVQRNMNLPKKWQDRLIGFAMAEYNRGSVQKAIDRLPSEYHEAVYLHCARIVALKGFEEDIKSLVDLKAQLYIDEATADTIINIARQEAALIRMGNSL